MLCLIGPSLVLICGLAAQPMAPLSPFAIPSPHTRVIFDIVISDDQKKMVTVGGEGPLGVGMILWDLEGRKKSHRFDVGVFPQFLPSRQSFASLTVRLVLPGSAKPLRPPGWDVNEHDVKTGTTKKLHVFEGDERPVALWPDKKTVVSEFQPMDAPESTYAVHFLNYETKKRHVLSTGAPCTVMCFSHDRKIVVLRFGRGTLKVFDWEAKKKISEIETLEDSANERCEYCIFLRDDSALLTGISGWQRLRVWDWKSGKLTKTLKDPTLPNTNRPPVLSPDGRLLATVGYSSVGFLDTKELAYIDKPMRFPGFKGRLERACFTPDGRSLIVGDLGNLHVIAVPRLGNEH
jgi:WD40 repeat protein